MSDTIQSDNDQDNTLSTQCDTNNSIKRFSIFDKFPLQHLDPEQKQENNECQGMHVVLPKTWTGIPMMSKHPLFCIYENSELEPCQVPNERVLEECLRKEADRISNQGALMNRLVQDSVEQSPFQEKKEFHKPDIANSVRNLPNELNKPPSDQSSDVDPVSRYDIDTQIEYMQKLQLYFSKKKEGDTWNKERNDGTLPPYQFQQSQQDQTLMFESRFESGNLRRVVQVQEQEQDLILKPDYNTRGNTQWFYFCVSNTRKDRTQKFNIINLIKNDSLYNHGLRPLMYSEKGCRLFQVLTGKQMNIDARQGLYYNIDEWKSQNQDEDLLKDYAKLWGWRRTGDNICYQQNNIKRRTSGYYYTLSFTVKFDFDYDTVYFCHSYPQTFTNCSKWLNMLENDQERSKLLRRKLLCQTIAGNPCDYLTITDFSMENELDRNYASRQGKKRGIVVSARVHPGETFASQMLLGIIDQLTGPTIEAKILRENFIFKVVPMLNIDGVVNGSNRCNLAGVDLNRQWMEPSRRLHPTIFSAKNLIKRFMEEREVVLFCDLHAHSRKKNIFMYGNTNPRPSSSDPLSRLRERIFPKLLENTSPIFSFQDCSFVQTKAKEACGRVVVQKELGLTNSQTLEASQCGPDVGPQRDQHFNTYLCQEIGKSFCEAVVDMFDPDQSKLKNCVKQLDSIIPSSDVGSGYFKPPEDSGGESDSDEREVRKRNKTPSTPNNDQNGSTQLKNNSKLANNSRSNVNNLPTNIPRKDRSDRKRNESQGLEKKVTRLLTSDNDKKTKRK